MLRIVGCTAVPCAVCRDERCVMYRAAAAHHPSLLAYRAWWEPAQGQIQLQSLELLLPPPASIQQPASTPTCHRSSSTLLCYSSPPFSSCHFTITSSIISPSYTANNPSPSDLPFANRHRPLSLEPLHLIEAPTTPYLSTAAHPVSFNPRRDGQPLTPS